jgi:hypothetical protein
MQYLLLGLIALVVGLLALRGFTGANTQALARSLRAAAGMAALAGAALLLVRGLPGYAISLAAFGAWLLWGGSPFAQQGPMTQSPGATSKLATTYLEVELDHATGALRGSVRKGAFAGRELENLAPAEFAQLWRECRFSDPQSAQIVEAYLDRVHPSWREDMAEHTAGRSRTTSMTRAEALEVLGLGPGASEEAIRRAHRELIQKLHPDHGGSSFLAAKINEAKDVLLGK